MKRNLFVLLTVLALVFSVVGCTPSEKPENTEETSSASVVESKNQTDNSTQENEVSNNEKEQEVVKQENNSKDTEQTSNSVTVVQKEEESQTESKKENNSSTAKKQDTNSTEQTSSKTESKISKEKAKEIALRHANVKESEIFDYEIELDKEKVGLVYEISFQNQNYEFDYVIKATDGKIIKSEKEKEKSSVKTESKTNKTESKISKTEAKNIALKHAEVKVSNIVDYEIELDKEKNSSVYEISFKSGKYEYDYEINAETGKIIKTEKEFDD